MRTAPAAATARLVQRPGRRDLHQMDMASQKSTFPIALGVRITGVDDSTFSQTGEAYSAISLRHSGLRTPTSTPPRARPLPETMATRGLAPNHELVV